MSTYRTSKLSKIKIGEYFRFENRKQVYKYAGKCRMYDKWGEYKGWGFNYISVDDVWGGGQATMTDRVIQIGFEY